ncbi:alpha/beta fold hydrolase [Flavobacterium foetidum]|uniref:alpha/beta fold hydrolase n=1 Tax=Flavobacterium foetidum TaxID=2026681 RepID=UPI0010758398|nr:alpha/beta hydrolase [Flavobacterium foetidum]KAF2517882.1 alpha/beta hydrolase [Flavobacterium foetidum]
MQRTESIDKNLNTFSATFKRHVAAIDSGSIEYMDEGAGIPIVFLHGTLSNSNTWRKIIQPLSAKYRCIAIDLPIGGHTIPLENNVDLSPIGIAQLIKNVLDYLALDKVILFSNDTGGAYAQIFASLYPENIDKLIFSNCEVQDVFPPSKFRYLIRAVKIPGFISLLGNAFKIKSLLTSDLMMGLLSHKVTNEEFAALFLKTFIENKEVRKNFASNVATWSPKYTIRAAEKLKSLKNPVLILWGEDDKKLFPLELGKRLKDMFSYSKLVSIPNSKTYVQEDQPEIVIREVINFIETYRA